MDGRFLIGTLRRIDGLTGSGVQIGLMQHVPRQLMLPSYCVPIEFDEIRDESNGRHSNGAGLPRAGRVFSAWEPALDPGQFQLAPMHVHGQCMRSDVAQVNAAMSREMSVTQGAYGFHCFCVALHPLAMCPSSAKLPRNDVKYGDISSSFPLE